MDEWLTDAIKQFENDPPITDFQRGYLAALLECASDAGVDGIDYDKLHELTKEINSNRA